jgi:hypothetical protein
LLIREHSKAVSLAARNDTNWKIRGLISRLTRRQRSQASNSAGECRRPKGYWSVSITACIAASVA